MLTAQPKRQHPGLADNLARGQGLVMYQSVIYMPVDFETLQHDPALTPDRRVWVPATSQQVSIMANEVQQLLFTNEGEMRSYIGMVRQIAPTQDKQADRVLINQGGVIKELRDDGQLHDYTEEFCPHFITTPVNDDKESKDELLSMFTEWLDSEEDAVSLIHHVSTTLAPHWPAVRYVLLIGDGRNGKSLIMKMLVDLFGQHNVSHVTRQDMSSKSPVCHDLTNKLLNVVFDGEATYLKDSGLEKTLTAGDVGQIRRLYETHSTPVQTNGLFIEGLNREPKSSDKSSALQKRIVRFHLPNVYSLDHEFEKRVRSPKMLGALLALLIDNYVTTDTIVEKLAPTRTSLELKLEHARVNNMAMQFLEWVDTEDPLGADGLLNEALMDIAVTFQSWRLKSNDISTWAVSDIESMLRPLFHTERRSRRIKGATTPRKVRVITGFKPEVTEFLEYVRGEEEDIHDDPTMVADRAVLDLESDTTV